MHDRTNCKRQHRNQVFSCVIILFMLILARSLSVLADPYVVRAVVRQEEADVTLYVSDDDADLSDGVTDLAAQVGTSACSADMITQGKISELEDAHYHTVIMMDNSASISAEDKEKAMNVITQVIRDHAEGETFSLYTFAKEPVLIAENTTDYEQLVLQLNDISYKDQDSCLFDSICSVLKNARVNDYAKMDYFRMILVSDGANDASYGSSLNDVLELLRDKTLGCVFYALGCTWEKDKAGLKDLQKMAQASKGYFFTLDQYGKDMEEIAGRIGIDHQAVFFRTKIPWEQGDGEEKTVSFSYTCGLASQTISARLKVPQLTKEEQTAPVPETETETEKSVQKLTEKIRSPVSIQIEVNMQTEQQEERLSSPGNVSAYVYLLPVLSVAVIGIIILAIHRHRENVSKTDGEDPFNEYHAGPNDADEAHSPQERRKRNSVKKEGRSGLPSRLSGMDDHEGRTVALWAGQMEEIKLILTCVSTRSRRWQCVLTDCITVGRSASSNLRIDDDRRISGNHCRFIYRTGTVYIEDLSSANGTFLNYKRVNAPVPVKSGDILTMGETTLLIEIEKNRKGER